MTLTLNTSQGPLTFQLFIDDAPIACKNFLALCASGYMDSIKFHRNIKNFILQGGDPTESGKGGSSIYNGYFADEFANNLTHNSRGLLSMCNKGKPNTNTSQFCILYSPQFQLDKKQTVFGKLIYEESYNTLDIIENLPVIDNKKYRPNHDVAPIVINSVTIISNPIAEKEAECSDQ